ncbi:hypothetical protein M422DRAFT_276674 [Sphaerobolus stellatus SS14]|uniref:F-box domain-containing protein n=1 Tax=Sphaerobolus stellatus (strain SS14) TaxID=990650 RepID=A0A0C9UBE1_SPHS4|nr:hypothetical protein M422DRAFT_276674 [Sphaerobolus stellatus SS14]
MGMQRPRKLFDIPLEILELIILDIDIPQDLPLLGNITECQWLLPALDQHSEDVNQLCRFTPNVSSLELDIERPTDKFLDMLRWCNWSQLASVRVSNESVIDSPGLVVLESFFKRHSRITTLALWMVTADGSPSQPWTAEILPNLRKLAINSSHDIRDVIALPLARQLTHVWGVFSDATISHLQEMKSLTHCVAHIDMELCDFLKNVPSDIHKLIMEFTNWEDYFQWIAGLRLLHKCTRLTHLGGINYISPSTVTPLIIHELRQVPQLIQVAALMDDSLIYGSGINLFFTEGANGMTFYPTMDFRLIIHLSL